MAKKEQSTDNVKELEAKVEAAEKWAAELNALNLAYQEKIEQLESQLAAGEKAKPVAKPVQLKSFKVGNAEHEFIIPSFTHPLEPGVVVNAEEALADKDLLKYLIEHDCGVTREKSKTK